MKPYFAIINDILIRESDPETDGSHNKKFTFEKIFNALDSSEFYQKVPKVTIQFTIFEVSYSPVLICVVFQFAGDFFECQADQGNTDNLVTENY